jgi:hypothetical protein
MISDNARTIDLISSCSSARLLTRIVCGPGNFQGAQAN